MVIWQIRLNAYASPCIFAWFAVIILLQLRTENLANGYMPNCILADVM